MDEDEDSWCYCRSHKKMGCMEKDCEQIRHLQWALARISATADGVINEQYDKALKGCERIAREAAGKKF